MPSLRGDTIHITSLSLHLPHGLGPSAFSLTPPPPCPAYLTLEIKLDDKVVPSCSTNDAFGGLGINYSSISKDLIARSTDQVWSNAEDLLRYLIRPILAFEVVVSVYGSLRLPRASLAAEAVNYSARYSKDCLEGEEWKCVVEGLRCRTIVGLHPYEQQQRQWLSLDVGVEGYKGEEWAHTTFADLIYDWLEKSSYGTLEALVDQLAQYLLSSPLLRSATPSTDQKVSIKLQKPSALPYATPGISIHRSHSDYPSTSKAPLLGTASTSASSSSPLSSNGVIAYIALGSNIGDRIGHIRRAVAELDEIEGVKVTRTSRLYESEPMYVEDQDRFINGVVEISPTLPPLDTLKVLKRIERSIGRTKTFRNGPRVVDLDLLIYGDEAIQIGEVDAAEDENGVGWLQVPHPRIGEREFVLQPLSDINPTLQPFQDGRSVQQLLSTLLSSTNPTLAAIIPFPLPALPIRLEGSPIIMQIFNATPDSFSDGHLSNLDPSIAYNQIEKIWSVPHPPGILDIGGMSTRPGSEACSEEEELSRVIPLIKLIRSSSNPSIASIPISIDTYRPQVAVRAVKAGASCVNDVKGGMEGGMKEAMAELGVPVVIMHSRGDSKSMQRSDIQDYGEEGVVEGVKRELHERVKRVLKEGVKEWDVIVDPGLGFAKSYKGNLKLLNGLKRLKGDEQGGMGKYPVLVGGSRKGFVGRVIGRTAKEEVKERGYGDAGVVGWCCAQGVEIVRVHDGRGMGEVIAMWRAIQRAGEEGTEVEDQGEKGEKGEGR